MGGSLFKIPSSSNLRWLIMFYALPHELVEKRPAFLSMPRKVRGVVHSEKWMQLVNSDMFLELVWDCYAWVSWQFFKVPAPHGGYMPVPGSFLSVLRQLSALAVCLHNGRTYPGETRQNAGILLSATVFYGERLRSAVDAL